MTDQPRPFTGAHTGRKVDPVTERLLTLPVGKSTTTNRNPTHFRKTVARRLPGAKFRAVRVDGMYVITRIS